MPTAVAEIQRNLDDFSTAWWSQLQQSKLSLDAQLPRFAVSYRRLVSLSAWRDPLLSTLSDEPALAFFVEGQNDAVLSHVQARLGSWRLALKSLRSTLENVLSFVYFREHPVEARLWSLGDFRPSARELFDYAAKHPDLRGLPDEVTGLPALKDEYATLSRAVHGSAVGFRMTAQCAIPALTIPDRARLGMWSAREKQVLVGVNLLLTSLFRAHLSGAAHPNLRTSIGDVVPRGMHLRVADEMGVRLRHT